MKRREREIPLGDNLTSFMRQLGLVPTGGRVGGGFMLADSYALWWNPQTPDQRSLFESRIHLSESFFKEIIDRPVPVDMRALKSLKRSPLALDIYCWLTYRMSYLDRRAEIPWGLLQLQFGSDYANSAHGRRDFKRNFLLQLRKVKTIYREAKLDDQEHALILLPSKTHIPKEQGAGALTSRDKPRARAVKRSTYSAKSKRP